MVNKNKSGNTIKKIFYIHSCDWPSPSPSVVFVTGVAYGLAHHVPTALVTKRNSTEQAAKIFHTITGEDKPENLEIIRIGKGSKPPGHLIFYIKAARLVGAYAKKGEVGAVITRSIGFLPYLKFIHFRYKLPCFFETHDLYSDLPLRHDLKKTFGLLKKNRYEKMFFPRINGIICLTEIQAGILKKLYPTIPRTVAPTGLLRVERMETKREKQLCYIGSLDTHKGLGTVLSALAKTADKEIKLLVIGGKNDHEKQEFKRLIRLLKLENRVKVISWIHHSDIGYYINTCIAGLVPLTDTPFNRHFTSPLKILDYLAHSLPVIGSDLPTVREYIEEGKHGILFQPGNAESLAEALDLFIARNDFETMSPKVEAHAGKFLWTERGAKIVEFINKISRGGR